MANKKKTKTVREYAFSLLLKFEQKHTRLDDLVAELLGKTPLSDQDRRLLKTLTSGVVRHYNYLEWIAETLYKGKYRKLLNKVKVILRLSLYELIFLDHIPAYATLNEYVNLTKKKTVAGLSRVTNGVLHAYIRDGENLKPDDHFSDRDMLISVKYSFPLWMVKRWVSFWGEDETEALCRGMNEPPAFDLRIATQRISVADFEALLNGKSIGYEKSRLFPNVVTITDVQSVLEAGWFKEGYCLVQDESANIPVELLKPSSGDVVLDVCAAPGGKFAQIIDDYPRIKHAVAMDFRLDRLKILKKNLSTRRKEGVYYVVADAGHLPFKIFFDRILIDAPCSGLGVIRKHPDIKWRRSITEIVEFSRNQINFMARAAEQLKTGGKLVYSTCTMDYLENENVLHTFLKKHTHFKTLPLPAKFKSLHGGWNALCTFPHKHGMDGSFCVAFQKK